MAVQAVRSQKQSFHRDPDAGKATLWAIPITTKRTADLSVRDFNYSTAVLKIKRLKGNCLPNNIFMPSSCLLFSFYLILKGENPPSFKGFFKPSGLSAYEKLVYVLGGWCGSIRGKAQFM